MKKTLKHVYETLTYNLRTLLYFEISYHVLGLLIIFPLARLLFNFSIQLSGFSYITNQYILSHLLNPLTISFLLLMIILLSIYIVIELIFLSLLYDYGYHEKSLTLKELLILGLKRVYNALKRYHVFVIFPAFLLFMTVQLIHLAGIYSTITFPLQIVEQFNQYPLLRLSVYGFIGFLVILFFETSFSLNLYTIDQLSFKQAYKQSRNMIRSQRLKMFGEFVLLNIVLNLIFYGIYMLVILLISLFVMITKDQSYILSVLLTFMYSIYAIFGLIATTFLIPINFALLSTWYYQRKESLGLKIRPIKLTDKQRKSFNMKILRRVSAVVLVILFAINISSIIDATKNNRVPIEFFNYSEIVAHRGASDDAPENTLAAIELALLQGSDGVEIDVRLSADQYPVLIHDATTGRTTDDILNRRVNALTLDQLQSLDAGSWFSTAYRGEKIPSLDEALKLISGKANAFVELKSTNQVLEIETIRVIEKYNMENSTIILSFDKDQLKRIKTLNSAVKTLLLVPVFYGNIDTFLNNPDIDAYGFSRDIVTKNTDYIDIAHQLNKKVYAWTVNEKDDLQDVVTSDIDGIITDRPIIAREIAYSKNTSTLLQDFLREFLDRD